MDGERIMTRCAGRFTPAARVEVATSTLCLDFDSNTQKQQDDKARQRCEPESHLFRSTSKDNAQTLTGHALRPGGIGFGLLGEREELTHPCTQQVADLKRVMYGTS